MRILALDPGERVGWAVGEVDEDEFTVLPNTDNLAVPALKVVNHGISELKPMALAAYRSVKDDDKYDVVIYETFKLSGAKARFLVGSEFPTVQFIGMVRLACWLNPRVKVVSQSPAMKSTADKVIPAFYADINQRIADAPKAHDESHDTDALRHLAKWHWDTYVKEHVR